MDELLAVSAEATERKSDPAAATYGAKATSLVVRSALVAVRGYYGEPAVIDGLAAHWIRRFVSMFFFSYTVDELLV